MQRMRREFELGAHYVCDRCFGPLEVSYDHSGLDDPAELRRKIQAGPNSIWRYADFLPFERRPQTALDAGFTPLIRSRAPCRPARSGGGLRQERCRQPDPLVQGPGRQRGHREGEGAWLRGGRLCLDRQPRQRRSRPRGGGGPRVIRLRAQPTWRSRRSSRPASTAPSLVAVRGNYDDVNRLCTELSGEHPWAFVNVNLRPYYAEGSKTLAFEVAEQLGFELPDRVVCPVASGLSVHEDRARLRGMDRARPGGGRVCPPSMAPRPRAAARWRTHSRPVMRSAGPSGPNTIAKSLAIGNPADGVFALDVARTHRRQHRRP